jgi:hypothetical protein
MLLDAGLIVGTPGQPKAEPRPVVKQMICAPPAACPVAVKKIGDRPRFHVSVAILIREEVRLPIVAALDQVGAGHSPWQDGDNVA